MSVNQQFRLSGSTLLANGQIQDATLILKDGLISEILPCLVSDADLSTTGLIVPGFIDLQLNGGFGFDFTADAGSVTDCAARLPETGVTSFMPTVVTSLFTDYPVAYAKIRAAQKAAIGALLAADIPCGIIPDGIHCHPAAVRLPSAPKDLDS
jgi:N-acetylglucosamine-6-phosphate deacetylase